MSPPPSLSTSPPEILDRLIETARHRADTLALRHKRRGEWWAWSWRDIVTLADRIASSFRAAGIEGGTVIALSGEIGPNLLLATLAARLVGAAVVSVSPEASEDDIAALVGTRSVFLAIVQGSEPLATWLDAKEAGHPSLLIVFDHAADARRSKTLLPIAALLDHAPEHGWTEALGRTPPTGERRSTIWIEASTDWSEGLVAIIDRWLASGDVLALPEGLAASARDRLDVRPDRWIVSARRAAAVGREIADRLPLENSAAHRFVAPLFEAKSPSLSVTSRLARRLLRRRLGLDRVSVLDIGRGPALDGPTERLFKGLGLSLHTFTLPDAKAQVPRPVLQLVLAEDAP